MICDIIPENGDLSGAVVWVILDDNGKVRIFKSLDIYIFFYDILKVKILISIIFCFQLGNS